MLTRMEQSDLFTEKLAGKFLAVKQSWGLGDDETPDWTVAAVNRSAREIETQLCNHERVYLLIRNPPDETVIGGSRDSVIAVIKALGCGAMFLEGVIAVHCPIAKACAEAYRELHKFTCTPVPGIDFYSCSRGTRYLPTTETAAQSIVDQTIRGFDYVRLINQAWEDGIRVFVEMGPGNSCTRAVGRILEDRPHLVLSLSSTSAGDNDLCVLLKGLATLAAHNIELDLARLFIQPETTAPKPPVQTLSIPTARSMVECDTMAAVWDKPQQQTQIEASQSIEKQKTPGMEHPALFDSPRLTARAHELFLTLTQTNMQAYEIQFAALAGAAADTMDGDVTFVKGPSPTPGTGIASPRLPEPIFDRDSCLEFARGRAGNVLGKAFEIIDTYPVRVRLPEEPLMLVDRIMSIDGEMLSMGPGRIVTQHDVVDKAWYLDGGKTPVSITIEAGQADLFLCSWLGIDHQVQGKRRYRLLDAKVTFHRDLPCPGETIEYHIEIDRFLKQGEIHLFFFHYRGYVNNDLLISMREGCAGFFTPEEVENSGGIILTARDRETHQPPSPWIPPVQMVNEHYDDSQINALRNGDLNKCFGPVFKGIVLGKNMRLPGQRMHLLDRVTAVEPRGGRFGLGRITAEADIQPDDWFLTCHFIDDMVMPGTLMYECCAHTLRIFTQRMGWISTNDDVHYDVVPGIESDLKCRGPVTVHTKKARYEIEVKEMGYNPEPYVIADAHMFSDNHRIVLYKNMGLKIAGLTRLEIERTWS
jgi:3-hydroxymyristoyl/3-hydroxydecanoyl-(acyl carrier protein) dehydratase